MNNDGENISVAVRLRPMIEKELTARYWPRWGTLDSNVYEIDGSRKFVFDKVYSIQTTTEDIYEDIGEPVVIKCMEGFNGCIFCYGQTGSGKTFTMYGNQSSPGIVPLSVESIFAFILDTPDREFLVRCSYLEVYNENINDLLNPNGENLKILEDKKNGVIIDGLTEEICTSLNQVNSFLYIGETNKQFAATNLNMKSSRSHCMYGLYRFKINVESLSTEDETDMNYGVLYLVDLAGSESADVHDGSVGQRTKEMKYINRVI